MHTTARPLSSEQKQSLRALIQDGLPLVTKPYEYLAGQIESDESAIRNTIYRWQQDGLIKRYGLVVNHHKLGYVANAMVVWDVPDDQIEHVASVLSNCDAVTLCYRRRRHRPHWNYNLFCMIHGKSRDTVSSYIERIVSENSFAGIPHSVLFSTKQYKQRGGRYVQKGVA